MHKLAPIIILLLACSAFAKRADRAEESDQVFQIDRLLTIRITVTPERWRTMQPVQASRLAVAMAVVQHPTTQQALEIADNPDPEQPTPQPPADGQRRPPGLTGNEYAYVGATVNIDGTTYENVGLRFKGQWSYGLSGASPRRPLKLDFNRFVPGQNFSGVRSLSLNTNALDPSQLRESLGYSIFRDAGIPAPRTCFALVYLNVKGVYDNEPLGLYTAIEEVNKDFLARHFGTTKGLLIRPERTRNLAYFGPRWEDYGRYNLQSEATPFTAGRFIDFTRTIHVASDEYFCSEIADYLDADEFIRFAAANVLMVNLDGVLVNGHNFYIYIHPKTGRLTFIPWDLHLGFGWNGKTLDEWVSLTIDRPFRNGNRLLERMMSVGWMRDGYRAYLREFATGCFSPARLHPRIDRLEQVVRRAEAIAQREGRKFPVTLSAGSYPRAELKPFITGRVQSVLDQLAGSTDGDPVNGRLPKPAPALAPKIVPLPAPKPKPAPPPPAPKATPQPSKPKLTATTRPSQPKTTAAAATPPRRTPVATQPPKPTPPKPTPPKPPAPKPKPAPVPLLPPPTLVLNNIDANHDGQLTRDEVIDAAKHVFIIYRWTTRDDLDRISLAVAFDHIGRLLDPFPASDDDAPPDDPRRPRPALTWSTIILQQTNIGPNRRASIDDLLAAANRLFEAADANHDGLVNAHEFTAQMQRLLAESQLASKP